MLRQRLNDELKAAMKSRDQRATSTLRLILAALKDRDIAARPRGVTDGVDETEIVDMLQKMVRQRQESIELYKKGNRPELAAQERCATGYYGKGGVLTHTLRVVERADEREDGGWVAQDRRHGRV